MVLERLKHWAADKPNALWADTLATLSIGSDAASESCPSGFGQVSEVVKYRLVCCVAARVRLAAVWVFMGLGLESLCKL